MGSIADEVSSLGREDEIFMGLFFGKYSLGDLNFPFGFYRSEAYLLGAEVLFPSHQLPFEKSMNPLNLPILLIEYLALPSHGLEVTSEFIIADSPFYRLSNTGYLWEPT